MWDISLQAAVVDRVSYCGLQPVVPMALSDIAFPVSGAITVRVIRLRSVALWPRKYRGPLSVETATCRASSLFFLLLTAIALY